MALAPGTPVGPYEILAPVGAGGMGEVYRARDPRLKRDVAIKVLPDSFAADPERMARFQREAEVLASLNHPHIAHIYGVEDRALVMEFVEGESPRGPMAFEEAWKIAAQIADALEYAHARGVIHRDLKPANVKVTPDGVVKLLDFGLAKALSATPEAAAGPSDAAASPTMTLGHTAAGQILGTAAYMAPEQVKGKRVDKRADIWAWGIVFYELLTGRRLFEGEDVSDTLAHVLTQSPDLAAVPAHARPLLERCLQKDPAQRLHDIADARYLLASPAAHTAPASTRRANPIFAILSAVLFVALAGLAFVHFRESAPTPAPVRFQIPLADKMTYTSGGALVLSPDGRKLVFAAKGADGKSELWLRSLDSLDLKPLTGTEDVGNTPPPAWSFDSRYLFFASQNKLRKIDASGGPPVSLCDLSAGAPAVGGSGNRDGVLLFGSPSGVIRVSISGGDCTPVTAPDASHGEIEHYFPAFLPDGRHFLYLSVTSGGNGSIYAGDLDRKPAEQGRKLILATDYNFAFVPSPTGADSGILVFVNEGTLLMQSFDTKKLQLTGEPKAIAEPVGTSETEKYAHFAASPGALIYRSDGARQVRLTWFDRQGKAAGTIGDPGEYASLALSPDAQRVAVSFLGRSSNIWLVDALKGNASRFTFEKALEGNPVWSPDGRRIAFESNRAGHSGIYAHNSNGTGDDQLLFQSDERKHPTSWSPDGKTLLYYTTEQHDSIWLLPLDGSAKPIPLIRGDYEALYAKFSPDGRWIAYESNESGKFEVYVVPTPPGSGGKQMISHNGGRVPEWSRDGKEILIASGRKLMAAAVTAGKDELHAAAPVALFDYPGAGTFQVSPDGKRFLFPVPVEQQSGPDPFNVILNWR